MERYILVLWPASQMLMEEPWFSECKLDIDSSADYLVPENRYNEWNQLEGQDTMDQAACDYMEQEKLDKGI